MNTEKLKLSPRHTSRIAGVQALYQIEQTNEEADRVAFDMIVDEFKTLTLDREFPKPDIDFFKSIVLNAMENLETIDSHITKYLSANWRMERLSSVTRALLRLATYELVYEILTPHAVIINEYLEITKEFSTDGEVSFVNGVLDNMSKDLRQKS
jgi:N utilization substance protein B